MSGDRYEETPNLLATMLMKIERAGKTHLSVDTFEAGFLNELQVARRKANI